MLCYQQPLMPSKKISTNYINCFNKLINFCLAGKLF